MQCFFKKLVYILLTLAIANISVQSLYASSDSCNEMNMVMSNDMHMDMHNDTQDSDKHCPSQKMKQACTCDDCSCDMCITMQANIPSFPKILLQVRFLSDISIDAKHQYTYYFHNPLLRPPIA